MDTRKVGEIFLAEAEIIAVAASVIADDLSLRGGDCRGRGRDIFCGCRCSYSVAVIRVGRGVGH